MVKEISGFPLVEALEEPFLPEPLLACLVAGKESYLGEKDLLFTAFLSWVCFPSDIAAVGQAVTICLFNKIDFLERQALRRRPDGPPVESYVAVRRHEQFAPLFNDLYEPLGGLNAIVNCRSQRRFSADRAHQLESARHIYRLIALMHYHVAFPAPGDPRAGPASLNKAIAAYIALFPKSEGKSLKDRQLKTLWAAFRPSLPFIYAGLAPFDARHEFPPSARIPRSHGAVRPLPSMLAQLYWRTPTFKGRRSLFLRFLARARHAQEVILDKCPAAARPTSAFAFPSLIGCEEISPPIVSEQDALTVAEAFHDHRYTPAPVSKDPAITESV